MIDKNKKHVENISKALVMIDPKVSAFNYIMNEVLALAECECQVQPEKKEEENDKS
jgi:hypothetical protein